MASRNSRFTVSVARRFSLTCSNRPRGDSAAMPSPARRSTRSRQAGVNSSCSWLLVCCCSYFPVGFVSTPTGKYEQQQTNNHEHEELTPACRDRVDRLAGDGMAAESPRGLFEHVREKRLATLTVNLQFLDAVCQCTKLVEQMIAFTPGESHVVKALRHRQL